MGAKNNFSQALRGIRTPSNETNEVANAPLGAQPVAPVEAPSAFAPAPSAFAPAPVAPVEAPSAFAPAPVAAPVAPVAPVAPMATMAPVAAEVTGTQEAAEQKFGFNKRPIEYKKPVEKKPTPSVSPFGVKAPAKVESFSQKTYSTPTPTGKHTTALITEDAVFIGDIHTGGDLNVQGAVKGNLSAGGDINITGKVIGNITANNISLAGCSVKGDIVSRGIFALDGAGLLLGAVKANNAVVDGKIKGDIIATEAATLNSSAAIVGNVTAATISMSAGAQIQGELKVEQHGDNSSNFTELDFDIDINL